MANPETESTEIADSQLPTFSSAEVDNTSVCVVPENDDQVKEPKHGISPEQATSIMEIIASTGKFWDEWDMLKSLLSVRLKQVLEEYPEAQITSDVNSQEGSLSGETFSELVKRLDDALLSFTDGPPFTLQRLCEILLDPKGTYRVLSKLALALEKNLLVTSTLTRCMEPYPAALEEKEDPDKKNEIPEDNSIPVENGVENVTRDGDEEMTEAETTDGSTNMDAEMQEEKISEKSDNNSNSSEANTSDAADGEQESSTS